MKAKEFLSRLNDRPFLCDGAMGTQLILRGLPSGASGESWNLHRSADVAAIHADYAAAGCDLLTTNTFGANSCTLERHGVFEDVQTLNAAGAQLARQAAAGKALVLGDIGPFGDFLEPVGDMTAARLMQVFEEQARALLDGGADGIIIETMSDPAEVAVAVAAARKVADWPIIATYAFAHGEGESFRTMMGTGVADAMRVAIDAGADVVGANCGTQLSLDDYKRLARELVAAAGKTPVIFQPNAGFPTMVDGKLHYAATPADMAAIVPDLLAAGVRIVGGCCGTTPDHLRAMSRVFKK